MADVWEELLGLRPGPDSDFVQLGGTSLTAARMASMLRRDHPGLSVADLYRHPVLRRSLAYDLRLAYDPAAGTLEGRAHIRVVAERTLRQVRLDLARLSVYEALVDGAAVRPGRKGHKLLLPAPRPIPAGTPFTLEIGYGGRPGPVRTPFGQIGWDRTGDAHDGTLVAAQPLGAPSWFPCNDRPDDKAEFTFRVTVPRGHQALANGALLERRTSDTTECWTYHHGGPMASYLAALCTGRFAHETWKVTDSATGRSITGRNAYPRPPVRPGPA